MLAFRNVFQIRNRDTLYGEACINNLYGDVSNYLYSAITSKALLSWTTKVYPNFYYIWFLTGQNAINFGYYTWTTSNPALSITRKNLTLTWTVPSNYNCKTSSYNIIISGLYTLLQINKWLVEDSSLRSMIINPWTSNNPFTWEIKFLLFPIGSTWYKEIGKFEIDTRTQTIKNKTCLTINNTWTCNQRSQ